MSGLSPALTSPEDRLRHQLGLLYSEVGREIRRRESPPAAGRRRGTRLPSAARRARRQAPVVAVQGLLTLSTRLRRLTGRDVIDVGALLSVAGFIAEQRRLAARGPGYEIDDFGFDRELTESLLPIFRWIYRSYWRVEASGVANVPEQGRALLVANHAGVLPWDGAMIKTALFEHMARPRHAHALIAQFFFGLPVLSAFLRRTGQTIGHPDDTRRLLERDELVLVFPEGVKGTGKGWDHRYRLRRFGRGGFVQAAIRAGAPIVPISVVGSEEIYPMLADAAPLARLLGLPYFPITPFFPWLGPLGMIPLPSRWLIEFHEPIRTDLYQPEQAEDQHLVMQLTDRVRDTIQQGLHAGLRRRRSTFL